MIYLFIRNLLGDTDVHGRIAIFFVDDPIISKRAISNMFFSYLGECTRCKCSWEEHVIVAYEYQRTTTGSTLSRKHSEKTNEHLVDALHEQENIVEVYKKLCKYLQIHSTIPFNDAIPDYIEQIVYNIKCQHNSGANNDDVIKRLRMYQRDSENEINLLKATLEDERHSGNQTELIDAEDIFPLIATLYDLPIHGERIRMQADELKHKPSKIENREIFAQLPATADSSKLMLEFKRCMSKLR